VNIVADGICPVIAIKPGRLLSRRVSIREAGVVRAADIPPNRTG